MFIIVTFDSFSLNHYFLDLLGCVINPNMMTMILLYEDLFSEVTRLFYLIHNLLERVVS